MDCPILKNRSVVGNYFCADRACVMLVFAFQQEAAFTCAIFLFVLKPHVCCLIKRRLEFWEGIEEKKTNGKCKFKLKIKPLYFIYVDRFVVTSRLLNAK